MKNYHGKIITPVNLETKEHENRGDAVTLINHSFIKTWFTACVIAHISTLNLMAFTGYGFVQHFWKMGERAGAVIDGLVKLLMF